MYLRFNLYRWFGAAAAAMLVLFCFGTASAQSPAAVSDAQAEFARLFDQIVAIRDADLEVPAEFYARYFELQRFLYPVDDEHGRDDVLDQAANTCPGTLIVQPPPGQLLNFMDAGHTYSPVTNNCTIPNCRRGRDVIYKLVLNHPEWLLISTCGSLFDTYLCVFRDTCCVDTATRVMVSQDAPDICGPNSLQAAIRSCFLVTGTYYIVLDGAVTGAEGDYVFRVQSIPDSACVPPPQPEPCTEGYFTHIESEHLNDEVCGNGTFVECGDGYCGMIDVLGDRDVFYFHVDGCQIVTLSAFANDTPGRFGYHMGLDPVLRLFSGPGCDHPIFTNDNVGTTYGDIAGNDARIVTTTGLRTGTYWLEITGHTLGKYEFLITCQPCNN